MDDVRCGAEAGLGRGAAPGGGDAARLIEELQAASRTMQALRVHGVWPSGYRSAMPDVVRDLDDLRGADPGSGRPAQPSARAIAHMDLVLGWILLIPVQQRVIRRIVAARSLTAGGLDRPAFSWRRIGHLIGASHMAVSRWHGQGIQTILRALAGPRESAKSQGDLREPGAIDGAVDEALRRDAAARGRRRISLA